LFGNFNMPIIWEDFETRSALDLGECGVWVYARHATTDAWVYRYAVDDGAVQTWTPGMSVPGPITEAAANPDWLIAAFNSGFERTIRSQIMTPRYGWPLIPLAQHRCLQASSLSLALPASLEKVAAALGLQHQKDTAGGTLMRKYAAPRKPRPGEDVTGVYWHDDPQELERLSEYCGADVLTERELHSRIGFITADEQRIWELSETINDRGILLDVPLVDAAIKIAEAAQRELDEEISAVTAGVVTKISQAARLKEWLGQHGCVVEDMNKATLSHALRRKGIPDEARRAIELRRRGAHVAGSKFLRMRAWSNGDNRARGVFRYHAAGPGRWSAFGLQLQNLKLPENGNIEAAIEAVATGDLAHVKNLYPEPLVAVSDCTRAMITAAPGHRLLIADFSGVESRMLAWLAGEKTKLDAWRKFDETSNPDDEPYQILGKQFGLDRDAGKVADLAFQYMGGVGAYRNLSGDEDLSDDDVKARQQAWRKAHPQTQKFWRALDQAAQFAVQCPGQTIKVNARISFRCEGDFLKMNLPSGRSISYPFPELITVSGPYGKHLAVSFKDASGGKFGNCRFGQGAYSGLWCENAVQACARDILAAAMSRAEAVGYRTVLHVHDEVVCEMPDGEGSLAEFKRIVIEAPGWAQGLPIACKAREGVRYAKIDGSKEPPPSDPPPSDNGELDDDLTEEEEAAAPPPPGNGGSSGGGGYQSGEDRSKGTWVEDYLYQLENGEPHLLVTRTSAKNFPQQFWVDGAWTWKKPKGWTNIPFRLPELLAAPPKRPVWITEGEKDCNNVVALGLVATTSPEGAGKWTNDLNKWFTGKQWVNILEDNDDAGRKHAAQVASALHSIGVRDIKIVSFPELAHPQKDVSDWLEAGHGREHLLERAKAAPKWEPPQLRSNRASLYQLRSVEWLWRYRIAKGALNVLAGLPDMGKGVTWCNIVACVTTGGVWPAKEGRAPIGNAIIFTAEDDIERTVVPRLKAAGADLERIEIVEMMRNPDGSERMFNLVTDLPALRAKIEEVGDVALVIIDPVAAYLGVGKIAAGSNTDVRGVLAPLTKLAEEKQPAILAVMHFNKKGDITNALLRISDSIAYTAIARSIYIAVEDAEDPNAFLFVKAKCNLAPRDLSALRYSISVRHVGFDPDTDKSIDAPYIVWDQDGVTITAFEAMEAAKGGNRESPIDEAKMFLQARLANGPVLAKEIFDEAKAHCITTGTLKNAKKALGVISEKGVGVTVGPWYWRLPKPGETQEQGE
jgi:DNA polymerase bacteriophage-type